MRMHLQIADHFDTLATGKVLAVGLFPDQVVLLQVPADMAGPTPEAPFALDLSLLLTLSHGPRAELSGEVRVLPPEGLPQVATVPFRGLLLEAGRSANIMSRLRPLLVPKAGLFTVEAQFGNKILRSRFEIRVSRLPLPAAVATGNAAAAKPRARKARPA